MPGSSQRSVWKVQVSVVSLRSCSRRLSRMLDAVDADHAEAAAAERDGDEAVRERVAAGGEGACGLGRVPGAGRGGPGTGGCRLAGTSASNRMRGIIWFEPGWISWNGTGAPVSSLIQRSPQSSKSR